MGHADIITEAAKSFRFNAATATKDSIASRDHIFRVTEDDGTYTVTKYTTTSLEVARIQVSGEAATTDTIADILILLAK